MGEGSGDDFLIHSLDFETAGGEETVFTYPLTIETGVTDTDGSESLSLVIDGLPDGAVLSVGTQNPDGTWTVTQADLGELSELYEVSVTVPADADDFTVEVTATATEADNGDSASVVASAAVDVNVAPEVDGPLSAEVLEDHSITFTQDQLLEGASDVNGDDLTVQDVTVDQGTITYDGETQTWTYTPDPDSDDDAVIHFNVSDGTEVVANSVAVEVIAVADTPDLSLSLGDPETVLVEGQAGFNGTITDANYTDTSSGFEITGRVVDSEGTLSDASSDHVSRAYNGIGVNGTSDGPNSQLGNRAGTSEEMIVTFDEDITTATVTVGRLFANEEGRDAHEAGHYDLYRDGVKVGEADFSGSGTGNQDQWVLDIQLEDGGSFDQIVFTAPETMADGSGANSSAQNSDYVIREIEFGSPSEPDQSFVDYPLTLSSGVTDEDGSESLSVVTLSGLPDGTVLMKGDVTLTAENGQVSLESGDTSSWTLRVPAGADDFELNAVVTSTEDGGGSAAATASLDVTVPEVEPPVVLDGFQGQVYMVGTNVKNLNQAKGLIEGEEADATFVGTNIDYSGRNNLDTHRDLETFLGDDADSIGAVDIPDSSTSAIVTMNGVWQGGGGQYEFRVKSDDGFELSIGGEQQMAYTTNRGVNRNWQVIDDPVTMSDGDSIDIFYWDQGGTYILNIEYREVGSDDWQTLGGDAVGHPVDGLTLLETQDDSATTIEDVEGGYVLDVLANDNEDNGEGLSIVEIDDTAVAIGDTVDVDHGQVTINDDGTITFTPDENFSGDVNFTYTAQDDAGQTSTSGVDIEVEGQADGATVELLVGAGEEIPGQGPATVLTDTFNNNNNEWAPVSLGGAVSNMRWSFNGGRAQEQSDSGDGFFGRDMTDVVDRDSYTFSVDVRPNAYGDDYNNGAGIVFGYEDGDNYYVAQWEDYGDQYDHYDGHKGLNLYKVEDGVASRLDGVEDLDLAENFTMAVTVDDAGIQVSIGGEVKISVEGHQPSTVGYAGMFTDDNDNGVSYDNFTVDVGPTDPVMEYPITLSVGLHDASESLANGVTVDLSTVPEGAVMTIGSSVVRVDDTGQISVEGTQGITLDGAFLSIPQEVLGDDYTVDATITIPRNEFGDHPDFVLSATVQTVDGESVSTVTQAITAVEGPMPEYNEQVGTNWNDNLYGTDGPDLLLGQAGYDHLFGYEGDDQLHGGDHNDRIFGHEGDDLIVAGDGKDMVYGGDGNDTIYMGDGHRETAYGGDGDDTIYGEEEIDSLHGQDGDDTLDGGAGNDFLYGQDGDDTLKGGTGNDYLFGFDDNDTLILDEGDDRAYGGKGDDLFTFDPHADAGTSGTNWVHGEQGMDTIQLSGKDGWTMTVTNSEGDTSTIDSDSTQLEEYQDASGLSGQVDFDDGSVMIFDSVEKVEW